MAIDSEAEDSEGVPYLRGKETLRAVEAAIATTLN
jgi:hypothetical protein